MTAPVQDKGREALEKLKREHLPYPHSPQCAIDYCRSGAVVCCVECNHGTLWPCHVARLIEALEEALRRLSCCHTCDHEDDGSPVFHVLSKLSEVR